MNVHLTSGQLHVVRDSTEFNFLVHERGEIIEVVRNRYFVL